MLIIMLVAVWTLVGLGVLAVAASAEERMAEWDATGHIPSRFERWCMQAPDWQIRLALGPVTLGAYALVILWSKAAERRAE